MRRIDTYLVSFVLYPPFPLSSLAGELVSGIAFLKVIGSFQVFFLFMSFSCAGFLGVSCLAALTKRFGAVTSAITSVVRKGLTLMLSYVLFPEHKTLTWWHISGALIFMGGLLSKSISRKGGGSNANCVSPHGSKHHHHHHHHVTPTNEEFTKQTLLPAPAAAVAPESNSVGADAWRSIGTRIDPHAAAHSTQAMNVDEELLIEPYKTSSSSSEDEPSGSGKRETDLLVLDDFCDDPVAGFERSYSYHEADIDRSDRGTTAEPSRLGKAEGGSKGGTGFRILSWAV